MDPMGVVTLIPTLRLLPTPLFTVSIGVIEIRPDEAMDSIGRLVLPLEEDARDVTGDTTFDRKPVNIEELFAKETDSSKCVGSATNNSALFSAGTIALSRIAVPPSSMRVSGLERLSVFILLFEAAFLVADKNVGFTVEVLLKHHN